MESNKMNDEVTMKLINFSLCILKNCNEQLKKSNIDKEKWNKKKLDLDTKYKNKKITLTKYNELSEKNNKKYFNTITNKKLHDCSIINCKSQVKNLLDYFSDVLKIERKNEYTRDDYINLALLYQNFIRENEIKTIKK